MSEKYAISLDVSIPQGTIKRNQPVGQFEPLGSVSIPQGTIKRRYEWKVCY